MKSYTTIIAAFFCCFAINTVANAQNWIPYQGYVTNTSQTVYSYPVTISPVPHPIVIYQWTPYIVPQTTVVEHRCLFRKTQTVITEPVVQWFYVPTHTIYK